jgi:hypothetical protein
LLVFLVFHLDNAFQERNSDREKSDRKAKRHKKADRKTDGKIEIFLKPP